MVKHRYYSEAYKLFELIVLALIGRAIVMMTNYTAEGFEILSILCPFLRRHAVDVKEK